MKYILPLAAVLLFSCSSPKKTTTITSTNTGWAKDSISYYETDFETRQKNYLNELQTTWQVRTMQRQAKIALEPLADHSITFNKDMSFMLSAPCIRITGTYDVKGTGVKFNDLLFQPVGNCANQEQENELIRLLKDRVSAYTIKGTSLLLRDNATNIVFQLGK